MICSFIKIVIKKLINEKIKTQKFKIVSAFFVKRFAKANKKRIIAIIDFANFAFIKYLQILSLILRMELNARNAQ